ncbi:MAG TPA: DUF4105 domain-containing protein [Candidatus Phocaeicola gallistercoris]|nr:DUF4105 domain-containing protein [Candidatus Phocaeicola gallistercoris]
MAKIKIILLSFFAIISASLYALNGDSIRFSLLTCEPGEEIYSLFGHTAIRYENFTRQEDYVFNYGMFSFRTPHFIYRFVKGETDYELGVTPYLYFQAEYAFRGSAVYQQVLNLTQLEKERLLMLLRENYLPENRVYRYNYFYDNCTTRARDCIEACIDGLVVYPDSLGGNKTFRSIVHEFTALSYWDELGIDFCLGKEADDVITKREQMFAPFYMKYYASKAYIIDKDSNRRRPFVLDEKVIVEGDKAFSEAGFFMSPMVCALLFLALNVVIAYLQWRNIRIYWGWDILLYASQGIAGCIITFLVFFSIHPTVNSNWLIVLFNPIPLLYLPIMIYREITHKKDWYHVVNLVYLTIFIVIFFTCRQKINLTILPLALSLLVNAASHVLVFRRRE